MRRLTISALSLTAALAATLALGAGVAAAPRATVTLGDNFFSPTQKTVGVGTKVAFRWTGNHRHNVTKKSGPGGSFGSETTRADGVNFVKKFGRAGVYRLYCTIHPFEMNLKLTVVK